MCVPGGGGLSSPVSTFRWLASLGLAYPMTREVWDLLQVTCAFRTPSGDYAVRDLQTFMKHYSKLSN